MKLRAKKTTALVALLLLCASLFGVYASAATNANYDFSVNASSGNVTLSAIDVLESYVGSTVGVDARAFFDTVSATGVVELVEEKGTTVIISSHSLRELEDLCDSYGILDHGEMTCSGELATDIGKVYKFQAAFDRTVSQEELGFTCMAFEQTGKVVRFITREEKEIVLERLALLNPIFVEEIEMDFEELFIGEVQSKGYLK